MSAAEGPRDPADGPQPLHAGRVGRPHGLDGSFYVTRALVRMLNVGATVSVASRTARIVRRAGTDAHPIVRLEGIEDRGAAEALRGSDISVAPSQAPALAEGEWWAHELEGCEVAAGALRLGTVRRMLELPSCEVLEVIAPHAHEPLLVPMVKDAVLEIDVTRKRIEVDLAFLDLPGAQAPAASERSRGQGGLSALEIDVFTLFPQWFQWFLGQRHVANAIAAGSSLRAVDIRRHTPLGAGQVDDTPFGGGAGMLLRVDVLDSALGAHYAIDPVRLREQRRVIALAPSGRLLDERLVAELAEEPALTLLCGRYEGFDERILEHYASDVISIGRYVLSGGELAAMVLADAVLRRLPGALGREQSLHEESFSAALDGAPEYPHYTRPAEFRGWQVPEVLLSGHHARIAEWRLQRSRERGALEPREDLPGEPGRS